MPDAWLRRILEKLSSAFQQPHPPAPCTLPSPTVSLRGARRVGSERRASSWLLEEPDSRLVHKVKCLLTSPSLIHVFQGGPSVETDVLASKQRGASPMALK